jgi:hypothetical protein
MIDDHDHPREDGLEDERNGDHALATGSAGDDPREPELVSAGR